MVPARGVYLPELRWGGIRQGGSHWPGTCWEGDTHGGDPNKVPKVAVELWGPGCRDQHLQGPSISCHGRGDTSGEAARGLWSWSQAWRRCLKDL